MFMYTDYTQHLLDNVKKIHFIGCGGSGMYPLIQILSAKGYDISGSDVLDGSIIRSEREMGVKVTLGHSADNVVGADLVVYSAAIAKDNVELNAAASYGITTVERSVLLGYVSRLYKQSICVSGTHGKTTTTSMATHIFMAAQADPTVMIGGTLPLLHSGYRVGRGDTIILESCEYCNSFLNFFPTVAVILNVHADHLDFFKDLEDIRHSFHQFAALLPSDGTLIINGDIDNYQEIYDSLDCNVITYGSSDMLDYSASNITYDEKGLVAFDLIKNGKVVDHIQLSVTGDHNVSNALASIATAELLQIPMETIKKGILSFSGTDRRFEYKGTFNGVTVVDDYAHHPTEIAATLKAAQHYPHNQVWCVFQPHTYTRTKAFFHEFAEALSHTDHLVLADIYAARETDTLGVSSAGLAEEARKLGTDAHYLPSFEEIEAFLKENCKSGDLLITMGAGDVVKIGEDLLK